MAAMSSCRPSGRRMHMVDGPGVAGHRAKVLAARHRAFTSHASPKAGTKPLRIREAHPNGDPSPRQGWAFPFSSKENAMFAAFAARESHRIPVLLGGSGLTRPAPLPQPRLAVLLRPLPCLGKCGGRPCADCRVAA